MGFLDDLFGGGQPNPKYVIDPTQYGPNSSLGRQLGGQMSGGSPYTQAAQVGQDAYRGGWGSLIGQLQGMASGTGPSLAQDAYRQASQDSMGQLSGMAAGSNSPAAARQAMLQQGRIGQGMASGLATARTQEQLGAMGQLGGALAGAGNADFQRDSLNAQLQQQASSGNQAAWLSMMASQLGLSQQQLQAMLGNQQYAMGMSGQPTGAQRGLGALSGAAAGVAKL